MKKTVERNRRQKSPRAFLPFLPAWVYLIDGSSKVGGARAWPWLDQPAGGSETVKSVTRRMGQS